MQNKMPVFTGLIDDEGNLICVGDVLLSQDGYLVFVCQDESDNFYGSLLCCVNDSCRTAKYDLNNGKGYSKVYGWKSEYEDRED